MRTAAPLPVAAPMPTRRRTGPGVDADGGPDPGAAPNLTVAPTPTWAIADAAPMLTGSAAADPGPERGPAPEVGGGGDADRAPTPKRRLCWPRFGRRPEGMPTPRRRRPRSDADTETRRRWLRSRRVDRAERSFRVCTGGDADRAPKTEAPDADRGPASGGREVWGDADARRRPMSKRADADAASDADRGSVGDGARLPTARRCRPRRRRRSWRRCRCRSEDRGADADSGPAPDPAGTPTGLRRRPGDTVDCGSASAPAAPFPPRRPRC